MNGIIPHNKPTIAPEEYNSIKETLDSGWIAQGKKVEQFEKNISNYHGLKDKNAVAFSNGTSSLFVALYILGIKYSDEIIIPAYTCTALLNAIFQVGAKPVLCDINECDFNISYPDLLSKISTSTKAIIIPHTFGVPFDFNCLKEIKIPIIEDCATTIGATIDNKLAGTFGKVSVFSFYASKFITTGTGGMLISSCNDLIEKARDYREFDCRETYYPRFNFQMSDIQGAMGIEQVKKINDFMKIRKIIADEYIKVCDLKGWDFQKVISVNIIPNNYRFVLKLNVKDVLKLKDYLEKNGVKTIVPIEERELLHNYLHLLKSAFPISQKISISTLSLPIYPLVYIENKLEYILEKLMSF